jgi:hypothetical protein
VTTPTIDPTTRVGPLLDAHPELEPVLVALSPEFRRLQNPILRRTVARVATLEQAARIAGLHPREVVGALRRALGQEEPEASEAQDSAVEEAPAWRLGASPAAVLDAEAILSGGRTPVGEVLTAIAALPLGDVLLLHAPFNPAPLVDAVRGKGHDVFVAPAGEGFEVWVRVGGGS